jgi:molybdate-binding protein/DNA-binding XRE family transcriptional regulator
MRSHVRERRQASGLTQHDLAARVGVSRQSLSAIEAGATVPSTALALELARTLGCRVEDLFALDARGGPLPVIVARGLGAPAPAAASPRVRLGWIAGSWIAHLPGGDDAGAANTPADGLLVGHRPAAVQPLRDLDALGANLIVAGCDPALGLLAGHLAEGAGGLRLHWIPAASGPALGALERGLVHGAGVHLVDARTGEHNVAAVRARLGPRAAVLVNLATWAQGLVSRRGRRLRRLHAGLRLAWREPGSGARALMERLLATRDRPPAPGPLVYSHHAVARAVAEGAADAGVATAAAASAFGLDFAPLADDRFDLVFLADLLEGAGARRLLETLASARFRRDIGALPGYGTAHTGQVVARIAA